jgi:type 1 glutamine amidotransferase
VLVFSKTTGFRHDSIPAGIAALRSLGSANGFSVSATEDAARFTSKRLRRFETVVFLNTTGDVLAPRQQAAFRSYIHHGGGWVGIHSAADTEYDWPFYGSLLGAYFQSHPAIQPAAIDVADRSHPSTKRVPARWMRTDEWYNFAADPRGRVHVLATLDESTYSGGTMGADHPIAWCHPFKGGRAWYTAGGHTAESYAEPDFRRHLLGGILWAAGLAKGGCRA